MSRTRKLFNILLLLLFAFGVYYYFTNQEKVSSFVTKTIKKYTRNQIIIPNDTENHRIYLYKTVSETDNFEPKNIEDIKKIYYTVLNNGWHTFTFYCDIEYTNCIEDVKKVADNKGDEDFISLINNYVSPFNQYTKYNTLVVGNDQVTLSIEKLYSDDEISRINDYIDQVLKDLKVDKTKVTDKDIERIHDYITLNTSYDDNFKKEDLITISSKANGVLFNNKAVCSGYADTFAIFLDKLNVPNFKVSSKEHIWNVVYYNKEWKHIDVTWDDDEHNRNNNRNFYLINTKELWEKDKLDHDFNKYLYAELD